MRFDVNHRFKIGLAVVAVIALALSINALVPLSTPQAQHVASIGFPSAVQLEFSPDVITRVMSTVTSTTTATQAAGDSGLFLRGPNEQVSTVSETRLEIFSARLSVEVDEVQSATTQVANIAQQLDGYVSGSSLSVLGGREMATVTIRVTRDQFYPAVDAIGSLGTLENEATQSDDVTEEYVDLTARRDNLQQQEVRLQEILDLAENVDEVLRVERELERVRGEIERLTGQINYLENYAALSTITTTFTQPIDTPLPDLDWSEPFAIGVAALYAVVRGLVIFAFAVAPFIIIGVPIYLVYRRMNRNQPETTPTKSG